MALTPAQIRRRKLNMLMSMSYAAFASTKAWTPAQLFAAGEVGFWYDVSDIPAMFQDSAGTTTVTAVEQPVGLILDKSKGLVLGSELVTNGDFSNGLTGWTNASTGTGSATASGNAVLLSGVDAANRGIAYQAITTVVGRSYVLTFSVVSATGTAVVAASNSSGASFNLGFTDSNATNRRLQFVATATTSYINLYTSGAATVSFDNISVRELPGNHASQSTSASRPVLSARVNLLTYSEQFDNAAWSKSSSSISQNAIAAPNGQMSADKIIEAAAAAGHIVFQSVTTTAAQYTFSVSLKAAERNWALLYNTTAGYFAYFNISTGTVGSTFGGPSTSCVSEGNGWYRCTLTGTATAAGNTFAVYTSTGDNVSSYLGDGTSGIYIWGADLRPSNQSTMPYQRIAAATDYDTTGFPLYLRFDGTDDFLQTASIDPGSVDKAQVFAGVRKLSDATTGMLVELSASTGANAGALYITSPEASAQQDFAFFSRGSVAPGAPVKTGSLAAPYTTVLAGLGDISGDRMIIRSNGAQVNTSAADQGTGNYLSYPLYIGRRGGSTLPFNGHLYGLIGRFSAANLPDATIASTETWMNGKTRAY